MFSLARYSNNAERDLAHRDVAIAKEIGQTIDDEYPGHYFKTEASIQQGVVQISHPLMPPGRVFIIKLRDLVSDPGLKQVKKAAGELLERVNQRRGRRHEADWDDARKKHRRSINGMIVEKNWKTGETRLALPDEWR